MNPMIMLGGSGPGIVQSSYFARCSTRGESPHQTCSQLGILCAVWTRELSDWSTKEVGHMIPTLSMQSLDNYSHMDSIIMQTSY